MAPIGLGIVGLGMAGAVMVHAAAAHGGYVLKAAADPHPGPRETFARDHNARAYADAEELMADPEVQAVYIATPHQFHAPHAVLAARHGKHIILEKPMALTLADCDTIIAAVERHKVHLVVGHTHAFDPNVRLMRDIIARGYAIVATAGTAAWLREHGPAESLTAWANGASAAGIPLSVTQAGTLAARGWADSVQRPAPPPAAGLGGGPGRRCRPSAADRRGDWPPAHRWRPASARRPEPRPRRRRRWGRRRRR